MLRGAELATEASAADERQKAIRSRIAVLRVSIARQRREIDELTNELSNYDEEAPRNENITERLLRSTGVLLERAIHYGNPISFVYDQTGTALRVAGETAASGVLVRDVLPNAPCLLTHAPGIYARATQLDTYLKDILPVLDGYLPLVEPHLETLIERFDDIERHIPFCLDHADIIVPHLDNLLRHLDDILPFAQHVDVWEELEPVLPFLVTKLGVLGPHLPLLLPHVYRLRPHFPLLVQHVDRLTPHLEISANADVLLSWFGWILRVPGLHYGLELPVVPRALALLGPRLPRWFIPRSRQRRRIAAVAAAMAEAEAPPATSVRPPMAGPMSQGRNRQSLAAASFYVLLSLKSLLDESKGRSRKGTEETGGRPTESESP